MVVTPTMSLGVDTGDTPVALKTVNSATISISIVFFADAAEQLCRHDLYGRGTKGTGTYVGTVVTPLHVTQKIAWTLLKHFHLASTDIGGFEN